MLILDTVSPDIWTQRITALGVLVSLLYSIYKGMKADSANKAAQEAVAENTRVSNIAAANAVVAASTAARVEETTAQVQDAIIRPLGTALKTNAELATKVASITGSLDDKVNATRAQMNADRHEQDNPGATS